jgi:hypothetical protein
LKYIVNELSLIYWHILWYCERHLLVVLVYDRIMNDTSLRLHNSEVLAHGLRYILVV